MPDPDMSLPPAYCCGECEFYDRCKSLFGCDANSKFCDWSPSRFVLHHAGELTTSERATGEREPGVR